MSKPQIIELDQSNSTVFAIGDLFSRYANVGDPCIAKLYNEIIYGFVTSTSDFKIAGARFNLKDGGFITVDRVDGDAVSFGFYNPAKEDAELADLMERCQ